MSSFAPTPADQLAGELRRELGRPRTRQAAQSGELYVHRDEAGEVIAFATYHLRRDGQLTIYTIGVAPAHQRQGVGRTAAEKLIAMHPQTTSVVARCPVHLPANKFWAALGFSQVGLEVAKGHAKTPLIVWRKNID